ncbi:MAG: transcriptional repressor LexA [Ruminococcaceae bacterium]|nr:transcriptional repressor LexA [Oscillospiraceae bacterium]
MQPLTKKEQQVYDYIYEAISREGFSPSIRDIQTNVGIKSTSTVHAYLARLEEKGYIHKENGKSRSLRIDSVNRDSRQITKVPLLGKVTAGMPILAVENFEGYLDFPLMNRSYGRNELFALRVSGESMIDAGIMDGDIVVIKKEQYAENGQIVVALVDDEATVKTFYKENGHYRLQPENPTMEPIIVEDVYILGKVVSVLRYYQ